MTVRRSGWPCANYDAPFTCLTYPSTETGRCDHCKQQAADATTTVLPPGGGRA